MINLLMKYETPVHLLTLKCVISQHVIDKVFDLAAIEEVVGEFVSLKKAGSDYKGLCPFHDDKHPSMSVSPSKGIFKCFSCGKGGNVVHFIMEHEGLTYPRAIRWLADKYHIQVDENEADLSAMEEDARKRDGLYASLEFARKYFQQQLEERQEGRVIYGPYLKERGIQAETIQRFGLGLSGLERTEFLEVALKNGYSPQQLFDAGLVKKVDEEMGVMESNLRDTYIQRIVFPIQNLSGKVLGFGGRIIKKDTKAPKYINSPETLVYEKRKVLYGLYQAKNEIRRSERCYVVEGYMDVISLSQSGIVNVVAVSGTAFTREQAKLLKRFASEVVLLFDGDEAGVGASLKHIAILLENDINVKVVLFPQGEDPDSFVQSNGSAAFLEYTEANAQDFVHLITTIKLKGKEQDPIAKTEAGRMIAANIARIPDPLKRAAYVSEASRILQWEERLLVNETNAIRAKELGQQDRIPAEVFPGPLPAEPVEETTKKNHQEYALLRSLILYADRPMNDEQDGARFIFDYLVEEEIWPETEEINQIFMDAFEHLQQHGSINELYFVRNPRSSVLAAEYISQPYRLSEGWKKNYSKVVPTEEKTYKQEIVENLNFLKLDKIEQAIRANHERMRGAEGEEEIRDLQLTDIRLQEMKRKISAVIGAVVL